MYQQPKRCNFIAHAAIVALVIGLNAGCASSPAKHSTAISDVFFIETHEGSFAMWKWVRDDIYVRGSGDKFTYVGTTRGSGFTPYPISSFGGGALANRSLAISKDGRSIVFSHWGQHAPGAAKGMQDGIYRYVYGEGLKLVHASYVLSWTKWPKPLPANILPYQGPVESAITAEGDEFPLVLLGGGALHRAALEGRTADCIRLLKDGANINSRTYWDYTAIELAIIMGHEDTAIRLFELGADPAIGAEIPALLKAVNLGRLNTVQAILNSGRINIRQLDQYQLLLFAATEGRYAGTGISTFFGDIETPRSLMDRQAGLKMLPLLLKHGVDINAQNNEGRTVLFEPDIRPQIIEFLLNHGADIEAVDQDGNTILHRQVLGNWKGHANAILNLIIPRMKNIDATNAAGLTPLQVAARGHQFEAAALLVEHGANDQVPYVQTEMEVKSKYETVREILLQWNQWNEDQERRRSGF